MTVQDAPPAPGGRPKILAAPNLRRVKPDDWAQLVRFCAVGSSGVLVNLAVFTTLVTVAGAHYLVAAVGAFCVAWTSNFILNKHWTFRRHGLSTLQQGARNLTVSLIALSCNLGLLHLLVTIGTPEVLAQLIAIGAVTPISFLLNRRWSFR